ncbi:hypothetical protein SAMN04515680_0116 [Leifsonia sp. 21MFCrub1.1]|nr:hypothetical protein SAMN04515680_0116 [Leifsonia sp. 21MFCrub1.1]
MTGRRDETSRTTSPSSFGTHAELYVSVRTQEPIRVACECAIGHTHTYDDRVERSQPRSHASS